MYKYITTLLLMASLSANAADNYDSRTNLLTMPSVIISGTVFKSVVWKLNNYELISAGTSQLVGVDDIFDKNTLSMPSVTTAGTTYTNVVIKVTNYDVISAGVTDAQGPQGIKGDTGAKGDTGVQGPQGIKGDTGSQGATGAAGLTGATGTQGLQGATGLTGVQGVKGDTGLSGAQGVKGDPGTTGATGLGVIAGGTEGQILVKSSNTDYDTSWVSSVGYQALKNNTTGFYNTAYGYQTLFANTTGYENTANGIWALQSNIDGHGNTANGFRALASNISGSLNTATGYQALSLNTTGHENVANGFQALNWNTDGGYNTATGDRALYRNTGSNNTANGYYTLVQNTTGNGNTANGVNALYSNTAGSFNTAIGYNADVNYNYGTLTNATAIGANAIVNASNNIRIGDTNVTVIEGQVPFTTTSDQRYKNHIQDLPLGLDFISRLRPVEYIRNNNSAQTKEWGIIAQELQQTLADVGYQDAGIVTEDSTPEKYLTVRYNDFLAPMIKAIQEQNITNSEQQKLILKQQQVMAELLKRIESLEKNKP